MPLTLWDGYVDGDPDEENPLSGYAFDKKDILDEISRIVAEDIISIWDREWPKKSEVFFKALEKVSYLKIWDQHRTSLLVIVIEMIEISNLFFNSSFYIVMTI